MKRMLFVFAVLRDPRHTKHTAVRLSDQEWIDPMAWVDLSAPIHDPARSLILTAPSTGPCTGKPLAKDDDPDRKAMLEALRRTVAECWRKPDINMLPLVVNEMDGFVFRTGQRSGGGTV